MASRSIDGPRDPSSHPASSRSPSSPWMSRAGALLVVLLSGCVTPYIAETRLHEDGSVDRAIWQPRQNAANVEGQHEAWERILSVRDPSGELPRDIRSWAERREAPQGNYLAAWGRFESADEIPNHATFPTPDGEQFGTLRRHVETRDLVFVTEHHWEETLCDIVTLTSMREASDALADSLFHDFELLLNDHWGDEFDLTQLVDWLDTSGRSWLRDSIELLYDTMARPSSMRSRELQNELLLERWAAIADRRGLHLLHPDGRVFGQRDEDDPELAQEAWNEFLFNLLQQKLVSLDGEPITSARLQQLTVEMSAILQRAFQDTAEAPDGIDSETWQSWHVSQRRVIEKKYGDMEKARQHYQRLFASAFGVFLFSDHSGAQFHYTLEMPGTIVETSGRVQADRQVHWKFSASKAFPFGYVMSCRSLMPREDMQRVLLNATPIDRRETLLEFTTLLDDQPQLLQLLEECRQRGTLDPLRTFHHDLVNRAEEHPQTESDRRRLAASRRLWELLGMEP